jgi:hypothetical protein
LRTISRKAKVKGKERPTEVEMRFSRLAWQSLFLSFLLVSCQSKPDTVVGKWQDANSVLELQEDGLFIFTREDKQQSYSGSWKLLEDKRLQMDFAVDGVPQTTFFHDVAVSNEQLSMKGPDGEMASLRRVK